MAATTNPSARSGADGSVRPPRPIRTIVLGTVGSVLMMVSAVGAGGILVSDPLIGAGPLSWVRYGHGQLLASAVLYLGFALHMAAWIRLGRYVRRGRADAHMVLVAAACWMAPLMISPPLFTRDAFVYLAQGALLYDHDPYLNAPNAVDGLPSVVHNVHEAWRTTPSPYGPLFLALSKGVVEVTGDNPIAGVIALRLVLLPGLFALIWALRRLVGHLGGDLPTTYWLAVASPMMVVHLFGGPHNELLMVGLLALGVLAALERQHVLGILLVTVAMLTKPTAALALPFLVWIWTNHLPGDRHKATNFLFAGAASVGIFGVVFGAGTWLTLGSPNFGWFAALSGPQMIANWMNIPTGLGQAVHGVTKLFIETGGESPFVTGARIVAWVVLAGIIVWQWWLGRYGGRTAVVHLTITLLAVAVLAPPTLPWYLAWALALGAAFAWQDRYLAIVAGASVFLVLSYYPTGEQALYDPVYVVVVIAASVFAWWSFRRPDPMGVFAALTPERKPPSRARS